MRGSGVDHDLRKTNPYLIYDSLDFDVPVGTTGDSYDRYLVRMEEMRQSARLIRQCLDRLPGGPVSLEDGKTFLPPKNKVLSSMEELIHQFMLVTQGFKCLKERFILGLKTRKESLVFTFTAPAVHTPSDEDPRPILRESECAALPLERRNDERHRRHPEVD